MRNSPARRATKLLVALSVVALSLATAGCEDPASTSPQTVDRPMESTRTPSSDPQSDPPQPKPTPKPSPSSGTPVASQLLAAILALPEKPEQRDGYSRDLFRHWVDVDANGCDTREEILVTQNRNPKATLGAGCQVVNGLWRSYYDREESNSPSTFDIDHLVPLAEAWDSGAYAWTADKRQAYANDLGDARALIAVSASSNRSKSDRDPAEWMPAYGTCVYISSWVAIKTRWSLSVDTAEKQKLTTLANGCGNRKLTVRRAQLTGTGSTARTADARTSSISEMQTTPTQQPNSAGTDPRFAYCTEAMAAGYGPYVKGQDPEYAWYRDGDSDGIVCES